MRSRILLNRRYFIIAGYSQANRMDSPKSNYNSERADRPKSVVVRQYSLKPQRPPWEGDGLLAGALGIAKIGKCRRGLRIFSEYCRYDHIKLDLCVTFCLRRGRTDKYHLTNKILACTLTCTLKCFVVLDPVVRSSYYYDVN